MTNVLQKGKVCCAKIYFETNFKQNLKQQTWVYCNHGESKNSVVFLIFLSPTFTFTNNVSKTITITCIFLYIFIS